LNILLRKEANTSSTLALVRLVKRFLLIKKYIYALVNAFF